MVAVPATDQSKGPDLTDPKTMYEKDCSAEERKQLEKWEADQDGDRIWTTGGNPILPKKYVITVARWFHDETLRGAEVVASAWKISWLSLQQTFPSQ